jgi:hypothetical protein
MIYFFTKAQLEARISKKKLQRIYDDNRDGASDEDPVKQLRADASSKVCSYLEPMGITKKVEALFDLTTGELLPGKTLPMELPRLALDAAEALAAKRHPEVMRQDWVLLMKQVDTDLGKVRDGKTSLGAGWEVGGTAVQVPQSELQGGLVGIPGESPEGRRHQDGGAVSGGRWKDMGDFG